jgi:uncharacterized damage-inducible protein DinB
MIGIPEVATYWRYIAGSLDRLSACVTTLDEAELSWRPPADGANSLRALAVHTFANAEENLVGVLGGRPVARDRDAEFQAATGDGRELERRWAALRPRIESALAALDDGALERRYPHPRRGGIDGREVLLVVARHAAEHLGQAELTLDLLRRAWSSGGSDVARA